MCYMTGRDIPIGEKINLPAFELYKQSTKPVQN